MEILQLFTSVVPILAPFVFLVLFRMSAKKGMTISMLIMIVLGIFVWQVTLNVVGASVIIGIHKAITILLILLGALALVNTLKHTKAINAINQGFLSISSDKRVLSVIIVFLFGGLIEGASGFGTPAAITGPLLVGIGFSPLTAAVLALVGDSVPVSFGAVGTPLNVGLAAVDVSLGEIANMVTFIDLFSGVFIPTIVMFLYVVLSKEHQGRKIKAMIERTPWTLFVGITYTLSAFMSARLFGFEFVSIIAPIVTLVIVTLSAKVSFLIKKEDLQDKTKEMSLFKAWSPYLIVVGLLLITRTIAPIKSFLLSVNFLSITNVFSSSLNSAFEIFYSPGTILLLSAFLASLIQTKKAKSFILSVVETKDVIVGAGLALIPTLIMVTIFTSSGFNHLDLPSMPSYIALKLASVFGTSWPLISPFLGILGSFVSGSATVSNLTFASIQFDVASSVGLSVVIILSMQVLGAAIGNMICVHNVVAASAVVNMKNEEGKIIKLTLIPALIYGTLVAVVGFLMIIL
jgi:lactate permease